MQNSPSRAGRKLNIALVSDFFYPNLGGVEMHQYCIGYCLRERGHKVVCITKNYGDRVGVRYLPNGIKVYHLPIQNIPGTTTAINPHFLLLELIPIFREIMIREDIDVIHSHQPSSILGIVLSTIGYKMK